MLQHVCLHVHHPLADLHVLDLLTPATHFSCSAVSILDATCIIEQLCSGDAERLRRFEGLELREGLQFSSDSGPQQSSVAGEGEGARNH